MKIMFAVLLFLLLPLLSPLVSQGQSPVLDLRIGDRIQVVSLDPYPVAWLPVAGQPSCVAVIDGDPNDFSAMIEAVAVGVCGVSSVEFVNGQPVPSRQPILIRVTAAATGPQLTAQPSTIVQQVNQPSDLTAGWSGITLPLAKDWVGLFRVGTDDMSFLEWKYTGGAASGSLILSLAPGHVPGQYELRYFRDDGFVKVATSAAITIQ